MPSKGSPAWRSKVPQALHTVNSQASSVNGQTSLLSDDFRLPKRVKLTG